MNAPEFWVAIAFVIFVVLVWKKASAAIGTALDGRAERIRSELDEAKRKTIIGDMQTMLSDDGGALIPVFSDWLDAHRAHVKGHTPHTQFDLNNGRLCEKVWLDA